MVAEVAADFSTDPSAIPGSHSLVSVGDSPPPKPATGAEERRAGSGGNAGTVDDGHLLQAVKHEAQPAEPRTGADHAPQRTQPAR